MYPNMKNPATQIAHMNTAFGNLKGDINNIDWKAVERQHAIFLSEVKELGDAIAARKVHGKGGIRDGIGDVQVTNLGLAHVMGIDSDADMLEIFESNMSKLFSNDADRDASIEKYAKLGVEVYVEGEYPSACIKSAKDQTGNNGEFYKKGKFLKGVNFKEPVLGAPNV